MSDIKFTTADELESFCPFNFENDGVTYVYDFNLLTVIQAENAREVGEFRNYQIQKEPSSYKELSQSRVSEWMIICLSYLLNKVSDGAVCKFDPSKILETESFVANLPAKETSRMEDVVKHFFISIGKRELISQNLQGRGGLNLSQALFVNLLTNTNKK